jgi:hypothetical protein
MGRNSLLQRLFRNYYRINSLDTIILGDLMIGSLLMHLLLRKSKAELKIAKMKKIRKNYDQKRRNIYQN